MAGEVEYARGAGTSAGLTGGKLNEADIEEMSEDEIKEKAREYQASWQMPPSGLYIFEIWKISRKIAAESKSGKEYSYRQVLGHAHGQSGNLTYDGIVLLKVIGAQAEIFAKIAKSESRKCLIDIRKWNGMNRINGVYGLEYIIQLLNDSVSYNEAREFEKVAMRNGN